jgi:hypothetical protein
MGNWEFETQNILLQRSQCVEGLVIMGKHNSMQYEEHANVLETNNRMGNWGFETQHNTLLHFFFFSSAFCTMQMNP